MFAPTFFVCLFCCAGQIKMGPNSMTKIEIQIFFRVKLVHVLQIKKKIFQLYIKNHLNT